MLIAGNVQPGRKEIASVVTKLDVFRQNVRTAALDVAAQIVLADKNPGEIHIRVCRVDKAHVTDTVRRLLAVKRCSNVVLRDAAVVHLCHCVRERTGIVVPLIRFDVIQRALGVIRPCVAEIDLRIAPAAPAFLIDRICQIHVAEHKVPNAFQFFSIRIHVLHDVAGQHRVIIPVGSADKEEPR